jgi:hypothetical protein
VQQPFGDELVDGAAWLERGVQLHNRIRPKQSLFELAIDVLCDPLVADDDKATRVIRVVVDKPFAELEDVYG